MNTCGICGKQTETFHGMKIHWAKLHMANGKVPIVCEAFEDQPQPLNAEQLEIMSVIKVMKEYFQTEDEKVYFFEPLEKEISVEDMQKIVDANEKLVKELKDNEIHGK